MKRIFDITVATTLLLLLAPLILVIAVAVRIFLGSPVIFRQMRPGLGGRSFAFYKFRSMAVIRGADGCLLPDEARLGTFGKWLRKTSLDELPQLWNVLRGDMSLVGPRPLLIDYLALYTPQQARRHEARPGITGWAQVNGRNAISWEEKFTLDVWYVDHQSFLLDMRILAMTFLRIVRPKDVNSPGAATMPKFTGSRTKIDG